MGFVHIVGMFGTLGINLDDIIDECCRLTNERDLRLTKIKYKRRNRKGFKR